MSKTVVGLFPSYNVAQSAKLELVSVGYSADAIQILAQDALANGSSTPAGGSADTGLGAKISSFFRSLTGGAEEEQQYAQSVKQGGAVLSVTVPEGEEDQVADLLEEFGASDVNETSARPVARAVASGGSQNISESTSIPVVREELKVGKRQVERGGVRIFSHLVETPVEESITLREERVRIDRQPVNRPATEADFTAFKEGAIELKETVEEVVVSKSARVVEEIAIGKEASERTHEVRDTVRHTEVEVTSLDADGSGASPAGYDPEYRQHFQAVYAPRGAAFESYAPAYQYGQTLANDPRYVSSDWATVEPAAQKDWNTRGTGKWEDFKAAVQHGWDKIRNSVTKS
jgi:uncharacterized protein (TIGR02271 family)